MTSWCATAQAHIPATVMTAIRVVTQTLLYFSPERDGCQPAGCSLSRCALEGVGLSVPYEQAMLHMLGGQRCICFGVLSPALAEMKNPRILQNIGIGSIFIAHPKISGGCPSRTPAIANFKRPTVDRIVIADCQNFVPAHNLLVSIRIPQAI